MPVALSLDVTARGVWQPLGGDPALPVYVEGEEPPVTYRMAYSTSSSHTNLQDLAGASVVGNVYIVLDPSTGVESATFWLLDSNGTRVPIPGGVDLQPDGSRSESSAPFTYVGGAGATGGLALDTTAIPNGRATAGVDVLTATGVQTIPTEFFVANPLPLPPGPPGVRVETTSTGAVAQLTPPSDPGRPEWTHYEFRWVRDGVVGSVVEVIRSQSSVTISLSTTTSLYAQVRTVNSSFMSDWVTSNTVSFAPPLVSSRKDFSPIGGAQALSDGSNRRPGLEVGIPSGANLTARGTLSTASSSGLQNLDIKGRFEYTGTGTIYVRNIRVLFGGKGEPFHAPNGGTIIAHDCEVDGLGTLQGRAVSAKGTGGKFQIYRTYIHHHGEGPRMRGACIAAFGRSELPVLVYEFDGVDRTVGHDDLYQAIGGSGWEIRGNYNNGRRFKNDLWYATSSPPNGEHCYAGLMFDSQSGRCVVTENYWTGAALQLNSKGTEVEVAIFENLFGDDGSGARRSGVPALEKWIESSQQGWHPTSNLRVSTGKPAGYYF